MMAALVSPDAVCGRRKAKNIPLQITSRSHEVLTRELDVAKQNSDEVDSVNGNSMDISYHLPFESSMSRTFYAVQVYKFMFSNI